MKISILEIIGDPSLAGAPRHLLDILQNLDLKKFSIHVISSPGPLAGEIRKLKRNIDLDIVPMKSRWNFGAVSKIRKAIKIIKPDVIHVHGTRAGFLGRLATIGLNIPVIYTEHLWTNDYRMENRVLTFFHFISYWFLDLFTQLNIAVSWAVKDFMVAANISRDDKIKVIYSGIEPTKAQANIFEKKDIKIATVGTLNQNKGVQYEIQAMKEVVKEFPDVKLEIIGDGSHKKHLQKQTKKLKLEKNIEFTGFIADVEKYLTKFDLYIQPSLSESFGLAITQAMSVGLPVIATYTGGIPEVVTEGQTGILVAPRNSKQLKEAILYLLRNPKVAKDFGKKAKADVKVKFNLDDMIKELERVYEKIDKNPSFPE